LSSTILVTGGTGFLGSYIIKQLIENGYSVRAICRSYARPEYISNDILDKVEWVEGDILDVVSLEDAMQGIDCVIHSAAVVSFSKADRKNMYHVNIEGTANVVNIALEQKINRFVYISSVAALGRTERGGHVNEEKKWEESNANTHYGRSKYKAELQVWRAISEGLNAVILNPSTILGFGDWHNSSNAIFKKIYEGFNWYTPGINGFVTVEDVAKATVLLMESGISEERFIINADNWSFQQLQNTIADGFEKKRPSSLASPLLLSIAWKMEWIKAQFSNKKPILTKESSAVAQSKTYFENDKLLAALPEFSFTPLTESIPLTCKKYLVAHTGMQLQP